MGALVGVRIGSSATAIFRSLTGITLVLMRLRGSDGWLCKKKKTKETTWRSHLGPLLVRLTDSR